MMPNSLTTTIIKQRKEMLRGTALHRRPRQQPSAGSLPTSRSCEQSGPRKKPMPNTIFSFNAALCVRRAPTQHRLRGAATIRLALGRWATFKRLPYCADGNPLLATRRPFTPLHSVFSPSMRNTPPPSGCGARPWAAEKKVQRDDSNNAFTF